MWGVKLGVRHLSASGLISLHTFHSFQTVYKVYREQQCDFRRRKSIRHYVVHHCAQFLRVRRSGMGISSIVNVTPTAMLTKESSQSSKLQ